MYNSDETTNTTPTALTAPDNLPDQMAEVLHDHAWCSMVSNRRGMTIWSCAVQTPEPDPDSSVGFVDLHRDHVAIVLAERATQQRREDARRVDAVIDAFEVRLQIIIPIVLRARIRAVLRGDDDE